MDLEGATITCLDAHRWYAYLHVTLPDGAPHTHVVWILAGDGLASGSEADFAEFQKREGW